MTQVEAGLGIGEVAERTGLSVHALRFYEREGILLAAPARRPGGRRVYTEGDVGWLNLCVVLRASGMPLPVIRRYTELARSGAGNEPERLALLREHEARVVAQIAELSRSLDLVRHKVAVYEDLIGHEPQPARAPA
ncbi:MerR family transcriptional regulator [Streptomyces sp. NBC_00555]|uniref:MerR family transcriptional regulator n=1 Tax=Streptomyces sp. NBC_00555 TaxID=2903662 RepID=UPI00224CEB07|nr:MerR family transcriptional regulator [Streptomyces sp. NBC_00555]MCX5009634.1 MerR family transcriptional regulator [Streptomyces sp. NBC_00555]